jgi:hypothetical protein
VAAATTGMRVRVAAWPRIRRAPSRLCRSGDGRLFVCSFIRSFVRSFIRSFDRSVGAVAKPVPFARMAAIRAVSLRPSQANENSLDSSDRFWARTFVSGYREQPSEFSVGHFHERPRDGRGIGDAARWLVSLLYLQGVSIGFWLRTDRSQQKLPDG